MIGRSARGGVVIGAGIVLALIGGCSSEPDEEPTLVFTCNSRDAKDCPLGSACPAIPLGGGGCEALPNGIGKDAPEVGRPVGCSASYRGGGGGSGRSWGTTCSCEWRPPELNGTLTPQPPPDRVAGWVCYE